MQDTRREALAKPRAGGLEVGEEEEEDSHQRTGRHNVRPSPLLAADSRPEARPSQPMAEALAAAHERGGHGTLHSRRRNSGRIPGGNRGDSREASDEEEAAFQGVGPGSAIGGRAAGSVGSPARDSLRAED